MPRLDLRSWPRCRRISPHLSRPVYWYWDRFSKTAAQSTSVNSVILDASALPAVMHSQPGADIVRAALADAAISAVNYSEVIKKTIERCITIAPVVASLPFLWTKAAPAGFPFFWPSPWLSKM
jgi:hypothetical protein